MQALTIEEMNARTRRPATITAMRRLLKIVRVIGALVLCFGTGFQALGQQVYTIQIREGQVIINGEPVAEEALPASLNVDGIDAQFSFFGDARPLVELNGVLYLMEGRQLQEVGNFTAGQVSVYFRDEESAPRSTYQLRSLPLGFTEAEEGGYFTMVREHAEMLGTHSRELDLLSRQPEQQWVQSVERLRIQANEMAQMAQTLPQMEVQVYLEGVQRQNQNLYLQLIEEWNRDRQTQILAQEIRGLQEGTVRLQKIATLRSMLDDVFEVKQQNRLREIEQLQQQIQALQANLQRRENLRERIIEQRLSELIGVQVSRE